MCVFWLRFGQISSFWLRPDYHIRQEGSFQRWVMTAVTTVYVSFLEWICPMKIQFISNPQVHNFCCKHVQTCEGSFKRAVNSFRFRRAELGMCRHVGTSLRVTCADGLLINYKETVKKKKKKSWWGGLYRNKDLHVLEMNSWWRHKISLELFPRVSLTKCTFCQVQFWGIRSVFVSHLYLYSTNKSNCKNSSVIE